MVLWQCSTTFTQVGPREPGPCSTQLCLERHCQPKPLQGEKGLHNLPHPSKQVTVPARQFGEIPEMRGSQKLYFLLHSWCYIAQLRNFLKMILVWLIWCSSRAIVGHSCWNGSLWENGSLQLFSFQHACLQREDSKQYLYMEMSQFKAPFFPYLLDSESQKSLLLMLKSSR